jgi:NitT/TauT family transport system permease protein
VNRRSVQLGIRLSLQLAIAVVFLLAWEYLPRSTFLRSKIPVLDPFFISSPTLTVSELGRLFTGTQDTPVVWSYLWTTLSSALIGAAIGIVLGAAVGLVLGNAPRLSAVLRPFILAANAIPRIALVPIIVIIVGLNATSSVVSAAVVVFFVVFFNAYEGARNVPPQIVENVTLLGASRWQIMRIVRLPHVMAFVFVALPNAVSFALVMAVTAEILTGRQGMGLLIYQGIQIVSASLEMAVIVILAVVGATLVLLTDALQRRVLHWWAR